jgi:hypothetical protein
MKKLFLFNDLRRHNRVDEEMEFSGRLTGFAQTAVHSISVSAFLTGSEEVWAGRRPDSDIVQSMRNIEQA